jgi:sensory rhodopsin
MLLNAILQSGVLLFTASSILFLFSKKQQGPFNTAFIVSFVTLISYFLMWQGGLEIVSPGGQPIFWTRWLFYAASCSLLIYEIASVRKIKGAALVEWIYLTVIVMFTGFLGARTLTSVKWIYFILSSIAYILLLTKVFKARTESTAWIENYIYFGWSVFPLVFLLGPTGFGVIGATLAAGAYILLDLYTKIIFNVQLKK